jgi:tetratricopeptide (TPR) repeat protein
MDHPPENEGADSLLARGLAASRAGAVAEAFDLFKRSAEAEPRAAKPYLLMGAHHAAQGRFEEAEAAFANAVLLAPELHIARYQLGLLQMSGGRMALAALSWQPLLQLAEDNALLHFVRGYMALASDEFKQALQHFELGLQHNLDNPALSADIGKVMARIRELMLEVAPHHDQPPDSSSAQHVLLSNYQPAEKK